MSQKNKEKGMVNEVQALDESMLDNVSGGAVSIDASFNKEEDRFNVKWSADTSEEFEGLTEGIFRN